jgi:transcriptional regulator with XRE-family HTH domain
LRQKQNIDAKTLARRAGIDASNLSRIEQGRYSVGFDVLSKIANALNAQVDIVEK